MISSFRSGTAARVFLSIALLGTASTGLAGCVPTPSSNSVASLASPANVKNVMPLGDSITDGWTVPGGYRPRLWTLLVNRDRDPLNFVGTQDSGPDSLPDQDHEGYPGWQIQDLRAHIDTWMAVDKPDAVLLNIGDNDILQDNKLSQAPARLKDLVLRICADRRGVRVLVSNLIGSIGAEAQDAAFDRAVPGVVTAVRATGCNAIFVDVHKSVPVSYLGPDGDHPTLAGYNKLADVWYAALAPMMARH
jgi:lysophospholipase L1-like esterase